MLRSAHNSSTMMTDEHSNYFGEYTNLANFFFCCFFSLRFLLQLLVLFLLNALTKLIRSARICMVVLSFVKALNFQVIESHTYTHAQYCCFFSLSLYNIAFNLVS